MAQSFAVEPVLAGGRRGDAGAGGADIVKAGWWPSGGELCMGERALVGGDRER